MKVGWVGAVGSVHLYFHPEWPDIKLAQAALLCSEAAKLITAEGKSPAEVPLILGGDWNSLWRKYRPDKFDQQVSVCAVNVAVLHASRCFAHRVKRINPCLAAQDFADVTLFRMATGAIQIHVQIGWVMLQLCAVVLHALCSCLCMYFCRPRMTESSRSVQDTLTARLQESLQVQAQTPLYIDKYTV